MNILILTTCLSSGGAERIAADLSNGLSEEHNVCICIFNREEGVDYRYSGELFDLRVDMSGPAQKVSSLLRKLPRLHQIKRQQRIDVTISLLNGPNLANLMTPAGDRTIVTIVNCISRTFGGTSGLPRRLLIRLCYNFADRIVSLSKGVRHDAVRQNLVRKDLVQTIYNPADIASIREQSRRPLPRECQPVFEDPSLINVGRLTRQKGQVHLLHIFDRLKERVPNARLFILGTGERMDPLIHKSEQLGFDTYRPEEELSPDSDVYFMGFRTNPFRFVRAADCFVFPSLWEGLGSVLIESLACGTPVVASDCRYGPREVLAPGTDFDIFTDEPERTKYGFLMPDFQADDQTKNQEELYDDWSRTVASLIEDQTLSNSFVKPGKRRAERFSTERIVNEWNQLIHSLA